MELSAKIQAVKPSPTVALNAKAKAIAASGRQVYNFAVGEPDFPTPVAVRETAIAALQGGRTKYGPAGGSPALREAIAKKLQIDNGVSFTASQIVVGIGAKEILFHTFLSLLNDGDEALFTAPLWVSYCDQIKACGGNPVVVPVPANFEKSPLDLAAIEKYATAKTKVFVLNSPNNPAGYVLSKAELEELGNYLLKKNWWIVADEIYEYCAFDRPHYSLLQLFPQLADRFILVNGMSKGYAMTGWRVGYAAGPQNVIQMVTGLQSHSSTCLPPFIEEAAIFALQAGKKSMAASMESLRERRDIAVKILQGVPEIAFSPPQGAFYLFMRPKISVSSFAFCERLLEKYGVALVPGEAFHAPGYVRMSYATSEQLLRDGLAQLILAVRDQTVIK